jgi:HEPN domain-containing protein
LASARLREARALFGAGLFDGAYYLAGYAVECALKACIAKERPRHEFPDLRLAQRSHSHEAVKLIEAAKLVDSLDREILANSKFKANWDLVRDWTAESRYKTWSREDAENLLSAVGDKDGVLVWIKQRW